MTSPFAIDLAFSVAEDIGLPEKKNDWITVSFLWTDGWGSNSSNPSNQAQSTPGIMGTGLKSIPSIATATPAADGSITHLVQGGETLWAIALAYNTRLAQIQFLNNLGQTIVIYEGQYLVIKEAGPTWTPAIAAGTPITPTSDKTLTTTTLESDHQISTATTTSQKSPIPPSINTESEIASAFVETPKVSAASPKKMEGS